MGDSFQFQLPILANELLEILTEKGEKEKALAAIEKNKKWRRENGVSRILNEDFSDVESSYPFEFNGFDSKERPIMISRFGKWDVTRNDVRSLRYIIKWFESMEKAVDTQAKALGRPISQCTAIHDMTGFSLRFFTPSGMKYLVKMLNIYHSHYPLLMQTEYCVNSPRILSVWLTLLSPFLSRESAARIKVLGKDENQWKHVLANDIPMDVLNKLFPSST